jgi:internalin A
VAKVVGILCLLWFQGLPEALGQGAEQTLEFHDPQLEAAVRSSLSDFTSATSNLDLPRLTCLWACNRQITNLGGLQWATNLVSLYLNNNAISDLTPLRSLTRLSALELYGNSVTDLTQLLGLTNLTCLVMGGYPVSDYSPISGLSNLVYLSVRAGMMVDLTNVQNLIRLTSLKLWENGITNISPLARLTNLTCLDLRWNSVSNLDASLAGLTNLTSLYLGANSISNVPRWPNLKRLTLLNLANNRITDLSPVTNLTSLDYLALSGNTNANFSILSNLPGLVSLELRGNSISDLAFMSSLSRLSYVDLAYNSISDLKPLSRLSGLNSLVLAGNPLADYAPLAEIPKLTNLWLFDNALSNASFVAKLPRLNHLNLDQNRITDIRPLIAMGNLMGLGLSRNPVNTNDYLLLTNLATLMSLRLDGNHLATDNLANFLPALTQLEFLSLNQNQIAGLSPILGLSKIEDLYLRRNLLNDIELLTNLQNLLDVDVSLNMLAPTNGSATMSVIRDLESRETQGPPFHGMVVTYEPTNRAPHLTSLLSNQRALIYSPHPQWFVAANTNSSLTAFVWEDPLPDDSELVVKASSSNPNLVSVVTNPLAGTNYSRTITVSAGDPGEQAAMITVTVSDDVHLGDATNLLVTVVSNLAVAVLYPTLDPNVAAGLSAATGKPVSDVTIVDLLMLNQLYVQNGSNKGSDVWRWLTNLTTLAVGGNDITNVTFLTNLTHLTSLVINNVSATDLSPLAALNNLRSLALNAPASSNLGFLTNLTELTSLTLNSVNGSDSSQLAGLHNLTSLALYGPAITSLNSLTNLTRLDSLTLFETRVTDLTPVVGWTNLEYAYLSKNRLANIVSLTNLLQLVFVDLTLNVLDLNDSGTTNTLNALANRGVSVSYSVRQPPNILINTNWIVRADKSSLVDFRVLDEGRLSDLSVTASSSDSNVVPSTNLVISRVRNAYWMDSNDWHLNLTPATNGTVNINVSATNDAGLYAGASIRVAVIMPLDLTNCFSLDTGLLSWGTGGEAAWFGQTNISHGGNSAAQTGSISDNGDSWMTNGVVGPGMLTFWWKVSSETHGDGLEFWINEQKRARVSGEVDWQLQSFYFPSGPNEFAWRYHKDYAAGSGSDCGWVAQVSFIAGSWLEVASKPTDGQRRLGVYGRPGNDYTILCSTNLADWSPAGNVTATNRETVFFDSAGEQRARFYRLQEWIWKDAPLFFADTNLTSWKTGGKAPWFGQASVWYPGVPTARSGSITDNEDSKLQTTVIGPGVVTFSWKVSSEANFDFLTFSVGTNEQARISGQLGWQPQNYYVASGTNILAWNYSKDKSASSGLDAGWVSQVRFVPGSWLRVTGVPTGGRSRLSVYGRPGEVYTVLCSTNLANWSAVGFVAATNSETVFIDSATAPRARFYRLLESDRLKPTSFFPDTNFTTWATGGEAPWFGQTNVSHAVLSAAQSGSPTNTGDSWLGTTVIGPGLLKFSWKVSSGANDGGLRFFIDGQEQTRISGETDWQQQSYYVPFGTNILVWDYSKGYSASANSNAGWVAQVSFTPGSWLRVAGMPTDGQCELRAYGQPGKVYTVLCSTNLANWSPVGLVTATNSETAFIDSAAVPSTRFYRLQELPAGSVWLEMPNWLEHGVQLVLHAPAGLPLGLQVSTDLVVWDQLAVFANKSGTVRYGDTNNLPTRFYRAALLP